ncbi:MAG: PAS domain-containing protein [Proteobacteria bacterium]|nr:PAS domain-containing protein [Pseudomonadota bacterium]
MDCILTETLEAQSISLNENVILSEFESVVSDLEVLANNPHLKEINDHDGILDKKKASQEFVLISRAKGMYDQIRFLDVQGMEIIRVNHGPQGAYIVPDFELQTKKKRYYFNDIFDLGPGEIFVSPLDLNIEKGLIEKPLKPMIRFGTPVFNGEGKKTGVVILNYFGKRLLDKLKGLNHNFFGENLLVNPEGYFLKGKMSGDEWGFMLPDRKDKRFDIIHPEAWATIVKNDSGQFYKKGYLFTFKNVYPVSSSCKSSNGSTIAYEPSTSHFPGSVYHWKIISRVSPDFFHKNQRGILFNLLCLFIPVMFIVAIGSWFLSIHKIKRFHAEQALFRAKADLEIKVEQRTEDLKHLNSDLSQNIKELNQAKDVLQASDRYYRSLIDHIQEDIVVISPDYVITDVNETFLHRSRLERDHVVGRHCYEVCHHNKKPCVMGNVPCPIFKVFETGMPEKSTHHHGTSKGEVNWAEIVFSPLRDDEGRVTHVIEVLRDITEERKLENQLRQSQKMEAIGRLSGGIAHDFNNILFPIMGYTEMAMDDIDSEKNDLKHYLREILNGVLRARDLVTQILAFSYQTEQELRPLKIHIVVKEALKLLKASIPSTIQIVTDIDPDCGSVLCDATQIHQVVMNLCTNAYHAMDGDPGVIHVNVSRSHMSDEETMDTDNGPGDYVVLQVSDTGKSIDKEFMDRIFEPYFTTKEKGEGTGLGLSVVHGIVKSCGGKITVSSKKGDGTTFKIFLPRVDDQSVSAEIAIPGDVLRSSHGEHLMLVDDDPTILAMEKKMLLRLGYQVSDFSESLKALEAFKADPHKYHLIITDFTMPNVTGETLARQVMDIRSDALLILLTGFSGKINSENARKIGIKAYIMKPVVLHELALTVRRVLDGKEISMGFVDHVIHKKKS